MTGISDPANHGQDQSGEKGDKERMSIGGMMVSMDLHHGLVLSPHPHKSFVGKVKVTMW